MYFIKFSIKYVITEKYHNPLDQINTIKTGSIGFLHLIYFYFITTENWHGRVHV